MAKRKKKSGGGANWMDTYADMVTLLLCFFVLLYSISSVDSTKFKNLVISMNPSAAKEIEKSGQPKGDTGTETGTSDIYQNIKGKLKGAGVKKDEVVMKKGAGFVFFAFNEKVLFDGDSADIKPSGKKFLNHFCESLEESRKEIKELRVLGHTNQARRDRPNEIESDRTLSSERATNVVIYIQKKNVIPPGSLVSVGYGQFHPVKPFDTEAHMRQNRRVEFLITQKGSDIKDVSDYYKEIYRKGDRVAD